MERFYVKTEYSTNTNIELTENEHHHLSRVMRMHVGDEVELVNGLGSKAPARVSRIDKEKTSLHILSVEKEPPRPTHIFVGIPLMRPSKLEWVIEKGTELGADAFFLYPADHSTQDSLSNHQIDRLRTITISALKQSKRLYLPSLEILPDLQSLLAKDAQIFFGDTRASAKAFAPRKDKTTLFITGPESGFSEKEVQLLDLKAEGVRLNPNVLRAETAPIVALSILGHF